VPEELQYHNSKKENNLSNFFPSEIDNKINKACPFLTENQENISSIWAVMHQIYNARIARDLSREFDDRLRVQHEVKEGNSRLDIRLINKYQNKVLLNGKNLALLDLKTGGVKIYQICVYAIRNNCPAFIIELLTGDVHKIDLVNAKKLIEIAEGELKKIADLKEKDIRIAGQECNWCTRECEERLYEFSKYSVISDMLQKRMLTLENNYPIVLKKLVNEIELLIQENL
jgi:hypothetical protein